MDLDTLPEEFTSPIDFFPRVGNWDNRAIALSRLLALSRGIVDIGDATASLGCRVDLAGDSESGAAIAYSIPG
jgi:precorrin-6B methylase 2